jgi:RNA polymerase sigma factor (sigma-70 family)
VTAVTGRMSRAEEGAITREAHALEEEALRLLTTIETTAPIMDAPCRPTCTTRGTWVHRLRAAATQAEQNLPSPPRTVTEHQICHRVRQARQLITEADQRYWRLAMAWVPYVQGKFPNSPDVQQEGMIGLVRAAQRFDPSRGIRFGTYATHWVKAQVTRHAATDVVKTPPYVREVGNQARKLMRDAAAIGIDLTEEQISAHLKTNPVVLREATRRASHSLDVPTGRQDGPYDGLAVHRVPGESFDETAPITEEAQHELIHDLLDRLDDRSRDVLERRFGFNGYHVHTLSQVGRAHDLSRERIRQLEHNAIYAMRSRMIDDEMDPRDYIPDL